MNSRRSSRVRASPHTIVQYWHSPRIPREVADLVNTFRQQNPQFRHHLFCREDADEFIAEHLSVRELNAFRACGPPAMQADFFRYCAAVVIGGISADADLQCVRPLAPLTETEATGTLFRRRQSQIISGFFVFRTSEHALWRLVLDIAIANIEQRESNDVWAVTGGRILNTLEMLHRLESFAAVRKALRHTRVSPEPLLDLVGDMDRVDRAFDRVEIVPFDETVRWVEDGEDLEYKRSDDDWRVWQRRGRPIFR